MISGDSKGPGGGAAQPRADPFLQAPASPDDVFISPHCDDVCFSLGAQALARNAGTLLTVFPVSAYTAALPNGDRSKSSVITQTRLDEDAAFARATGLQACCLPFRDARMREQTPFDSRLATAMVVQIEARLIGALMGPMIGRRPGVSPWLFCPAAIGGHLDHVTVLLTVWKNRALLSRHYRLAFYEDLHYASDRLRRERGLANLHRLLGGVVLRRVAWPLDEKQQAAKMRLVWLHASQLTPQISTIAAYTPAVSQSATPHEAVWVLQSDAHQRPG